MTAGLTIIAEMFDLRIAREVDLEAEFVAYQPHSTLLQIRFELARLNLRFVKIVHNEVTVVIPWYDALYSCHITLYTA